MQPFTAIFLAALFLTLGTRIWLATRHIRHVQANRNCVPREFSSQITLEAHQKAADYTCAKTRLGYVSMLLEVVVLMILTLGGGLNGLASLWSSWFGDPITHGAALIISTALLMSAVGIRRLPKRYRPRCRSFRRARRFKSPPESCWFC